MKAYRFSRSQPADHDGCFGFADARALPPKDLLEIWRSDGPCLASKFGNPHTVPLASCVPCQDLRLCAWAIGRLRQGLTGGEERTPRSCPSPSTQQGTCKSTGPTNIHTDNSTSPQFHDSLPTLSSVCSLRIALCAPCSASTPKSSTPLIPTHKHRKNERRGKSTPPLPFATRSGCPHLAIPSGRRPARNAETAKMMPSPFGFMEFGNGLLARPQWCFSNYHCRYFAPISCNLRLAKSVVCCYLCWAGQACYTSAIKNVGAWLNLLHKMDSIGREAGC